MCKRAVHGDQRVERIRKEAQAMRESVAKTEPRKNAKGVPLKGVHCVAPDAKTRAAMQLKLA